MCGICGIINFNNELVEERNIRQMMQKIKHRGPDDEGIFIDHKVGLGFVRLSIIDLSPAGNQPMFSDDGRYIIVFNGEIFNYIELKRELINLGYSFKTKTDTEVLLTSYIHWGKGCLDHFNGMWSFIIYDQVEKSIFGSRDRHGIKPFYYLKTDNFFAFASEPIPLLSLLNHKPNPDYNSIFDFLAYNRTDQNENTFFAEIKKLQHSYCFTIKGDQLAFEKWYNLRDQLSESKGFKDFKEFNQLFSSAVGIRLRSDVPVGVCLSGGLDSSSIVSNLLLDHKVSNLNTFSAVYNKGQLGDETEFIQEYEPLISNMFFTSPDAKSFLADYMYFIKAHGEPMPSTSPYAQYKVMELAGKKVVVTLDGQGADEEMAGYHYFFGVFFKDLLKHLRFGKLSTEMFYYLVKHKSLFGIKTFLFFLLPNQFRSLSQVGHKGYLKRNFVKQYKNETSIAKDIYGSPNLKESLIDHFEFKLEHLLKWEDRNSMRFSIEARVPFLDYRLVERVLSTSTDMIIKEGMTKHLLRESMKGILPEKIRLRVDKIGFETPQDEWFCEPEWRTVIWDVLNSKTFEERNIIDPQKAKEQYRNHLSGKIKVSNEIWKWLNLELWFREFID
jgi:asparagine synthase (glutamine-hydrolysing)